MEEMRMKKTILAFACLLAFMLTDYADAQSLSDAEAYLNRGLAYCEQGDFDSAIADFTQAIKLDPNYAHAYIYRGVAYGTKGDNDSAIADFTQFIRLYPNDAEGYVGRGGAYYMKGDRARARTDLSKALELDPDNAMTRSLFEVAK
jgi:tetratricopeptide (TPR) repeat protein